MEADLAKTRAIAVSLNGVSVGPGSITYVDLAVDVRAFVDPIDWDLVQPGDDGALEVDDGDQLQSVLAGLGEAFTRSP